MKTIGGIGIRGFILALALSVGSGFMPQAFADALVIVNPDGKVTYLDIPGELASREGGINDSGQVAGNYRTADFSSHAFITGPNGVGATDLGSLGGNLSQAWGVNNAGQVVGQSTILDGSWHAFITGPNGMGMRDLGTLGGTESYARDINDSGQVAGYSTTSNPSDGSYHAFITGPNGMEMRDLGRSGSQADGINDSGQVVGHDTNGSFSFITGPNGMGITPLGGAPTPTSINNSGQVAGYSSTSDSFPHAFITGPNGVGVRDVHPGTGGFSLAWNLNDSGQVVGSANHHAFITGPDGMGGTRLDSIVDLPGETYFRQGLDINNLGQVTAIISIPIPEPASYALMLAGLGLIGFIAGRKKLPDNTLERG